MIDVSAKPVVAREASAAGRLVLKPATARAVREGRIKKGDVLEVSRVAAVQAVKRTPDFLPLCHPIPVEKVTVDFSVGPSYLDAQVAVRAHWKTGVEMEALTGVCAGLLCAWDMTKYLEKDAAGQYPATRIEGLRVLTKRKGGK
jgi:cyclic pyranopterin phosphate synthase